MRRGLHLATASATALFAVAGLAFVLVDGTNAASSGRFTHRGTVVNVVDGDTIDVRLTSGKQERVRLIGIDTTERGACFSSEASSRARALALNRPVTLRGDATQDTRDRYGRLLAYVWLPGGQDLGYQLVAGGFAKVFVYRDVFQRHPAYAGAERRAKASTRGLWGQCATQNTTPQPVAPAPPSSASCHASYSPCLPIVGDLDCADIRALGKAPVRVVGSDPYRLDGDGDGWGCE